MWESAKRGVRNRPGTIRSSSTLTRSEGETCSSGKARLLLWRSEAPSHTSGNGAPRAPGRAGLGGDKRRLCRRDPEAAGRPGSLAERGQESRKGAEPGWGSPRYRPPSPGTASSGRQGARPRPGPAPSGGAGSPRAAPGPALRFSRGHVIRAPRAEAASSRPAANGRLACGGLRGERAGGAAGRWRRRRLPGGGRGLREGMARRAARSG